MRELNKHFLVILKDDITKHKDEPAWEHEEEYKNNNIWIWIWD